MQFGYGKDFKNLLWIYQDLYIGIILVFIDNTCTSKASYWFCMQWFLARW